MQGFFGLTQVDDPYPLYRRLRGLGPAVQIAQGVWAVSRYEDVVRVLKDHASFSSRALSGGFGPGATTVIGADPPEHTRLRGIVNRAFTPRMVAALEPRIREITDNLIDAAEAKQEFDLVADLAVPLPVMIIAEVLGVDSARYDDFKRWSDSFLFSDAARGRVRDEDSRQEFREYLGEVIDARRREPRDDLISALTLAEGAETLTAAEVMAFATLLLIAGNETTTNLIGNAVLALMENPDQMALAQGDRALVPNLVEEALRYQSPVQLIMRLALRDAEIGGVTIPAGSLVLPMFASANRDERRFADPDRFDIRRENARDHVAFGYGIHFCLGAPLARLEAQVALEAVVTRLTGLELAEGRVEWLDSFLLRGPRRLPLRLRPAGTATEARR
jgi:cytochrome P450